MTDDMQFEMLLNSMLHETANPLPSEALGQRVLAASVKPEPIAGVLLAAGEISGESIFSSLWNGVRGLLFPSRLPPLVLESRPIPVIDRMAMEGNYSSTAYAVAVHAMAIFLIGFVVRAQIRDVEQVHSSIKLIDPALATISKNAAERGGGGGGQAGEAPVSKGHLPKLAEQQMVAPTNPPLEAPRIAIEPTIEVHDIRLADNVMPNVGIPNSPIAGVSMGDGRGTGIGSGDGTGMGQGSGGNKGGGVRRVGGGVSRPEVIYSVEPEFSDEARRAKASGDVDVYLWVDEHGNPTHVRVARGMGMGLDEKAVEAVKQYRFKPAMEDGKPVTVEMYVVVNFQIF
jgi:protein TonB